MTHPSFDAFRLAFRDPVSRVRLNTDVSESYYSRIERITITGGYLDGLDIKFSDHLNSIIGGRGTGKSTLIECIRYAMGMNTSTKSAQKQHEDILKEMLCSLKLLFSRSLW
ncbi:AAA family ATPase [Alicyclobacillus mengziensis]